MSQPVQVSGAPALPERSGWAIAGTLMVAVFGGAGVGSAAVWWLAPESSVGAVVGFLMLPLVLGVGYQLWQARIIAIVMRRFGKGLFAALWQLVRRRRPNVAPLMPTREDAASLLFAAIRAASSFTHAGTGIGLFAGVVAGLAAPTGRFWLTAGILLVLSATYGAALTRLARAGYLPPPDGGD